MRVFSDDAVLIATATLAIVPPTVVFSGTMPVILLPYTGQVCRTTVFSVLGKLQCALGQVCCNVPYVFCSACALMYMYRGLNTCVNILSVTVRGDGESQADVFVQSSQHLNANLL